MQKILTKTLLLEQELRFKSCDSFLSVLTSEENSNRHLSLANEGQYLLVNTNSVKYLIDQMSDLKVNERYPGGIDFTYRL